MENEENAYRKEPLKKKSKIGSVSALGEEDEDPFLKEYPYPVLISMFGVSLCKQVQENSRRIMETEEGKVYLEVPGPCDGPNFGSSVFIFSKYEKALKEKADLIHNKIRRSPRFPAYTPPLLSKEEEDKMLSIHQRDTRLDKALFFTREYNFVKGIKCCISSGFTNVTCTGEYCFDSSWVAVHGFDTICMVTCRKPLDMTRLGSYYRDCRSDSLALRDFPEAVISEVEHIPYDGSGYKHENLRRHCSGKVVKPFGVVSLAQTTQKSLKKAIDPVIKFLEQKMKDSCSAFTDYKTMETAIGAYQCMFPGQELRAEDILVTLLDVSSDVTSGAFTHLNIEIIREELNVKSSGSRSNIPLLYRHLTLQTPPQDSEGVF